MNKISKIWTAGIAYVALAVGAGLSIMYNVLQTAAIRGEQLAWPDIVTAVAMPGLVVLMVELFVSRLWIGRPWYVQIIRVATVAIVGGVAMRASWTHGHDWMLTHGHTADVATLWPLAIDLLAILATALILAGRLTNGQVPPAASPGQASANALDTLATGEAAKPSPVASLEPAVDGQLAEDLDAWERAADLAIGQAGRELADEAEALANHRPPADLVTAPVATVAGVPDAARELILECLAAGDQAGQVDKLVAATHDVSERTARRWRQAVAAS